MNQNFPNSFYGHPKKPSYITACFNLYADNLSCGRGCRWADLDAFSCKVLIRDSPCDQRPGREQKLAEGYSR